MVPKNYPHPPRPADFFISEEDISNYQARESRLWDLGPKLSIATGVVIVGSIGLVDIDWKWMFSYGALSASTYIGLFGLLAGWLFLSLFASIFAAFVVLPVGELWLRRSEKAKSIRSYKAAVVEFNAWLSRSRQSWWQNLSGRNFELELAKLFRGMGWKAVATKASGDGGVDIVGVRVGIKFIAQCKNHKKLVGPSVVRELYGTLLAADAKFAILASVSGFTKGTTSFAKGKPIELVGLDWILERHMELDGGWKSLTCSNSAASKKNRTWRSSPRLDS